MKAIDIHTHFFPESWPDLAARFGTPDWPWIKHTEPGKAMVMVGDREFRAITSACWDVNVRLEDMERDGIDLQIVSATPVLFAYGREPKDALDCARLFNDAALEFCGPSRGKIKSLCQVPLQDIDASCAELTRCMKAGHLGVQIGNHVGEKNLDDPGILEFLRHCAHEGAAVLVHPWDMLGAPRMPKYMMPWTVGMPAETQLALVALIVSGAFDHLPEDLRICFAHGGGSFAFLLGRLENAWHHHPVARGASKFQPSHYLNRFFVDSAVFDAQTLQFLVDKMGPGRVLLGSDYPFPLGEQRVGSLIRDSRMSTEVKAQLLSANATRWLGVESGAEEAGQTAGRAGEVAQVRGSASGCPVGFSSRETDGPPPINDSSPKLTYSSYLKIPELLKLQAPESSPEHHDELLFIVVHQTYELWFKELLHDLDAVVANLSDAAAKPESRDGVYEAARLLRRCTEIMRVLVEQFTILETMLPTHFLAFREKLAPASGFQSEQFREIEFLCGLKDEKMLRYHELTPETHKILNRRLHEPSLRDVFFAALKALRLPAGSGASAVGGGSAELETFESRARAIHALYADEKNHRDWIDVCERLTEFDELVVSWRLRHIQMVERTIGIRTGTGGSTGSSYLKLTLDKKFFPELWEARTYLQG
ncbi:MAG TPA: tryptophan 2,3-dioxygenase family protein [Candidatus Acidoferrales bacterium]